MVTDAAAYGALALLGLATIVFGFVPLFRRPEGEADGPVDAWEELSTR
jgi:hypothetical protein